MSHILKTVGVTSITDVTDASKVLGINLTSATTATATTFLFAQTSNRQWTWTDASDTVVGTTIAQTINNKTIYEPVAATISAAGSTLGTATALTNMNNVVTTVAASSGVSLPVLLFAGLRITITNRGANSLNVYPAAAGVSIDLASAGSPVIVPVNATIILESSSTTQWNSVNPVLVSGTGVSITYGNGQTTIGITGVTTFSAGTTGFTPSSAATGAITLAGILVPANGGTGVNNGSFTTTLGGSLTTAGAFTTSGANALTLTTSGTTNVTLPTTGTLLTSASAVSSFNAGTTGFTPSIATTGAVTLAGILIPANGGTGVNNGSFTMTVGGSLITAGAFTTSGANALTLTTSGTTNVTLPTTGTLLTSAGAVTSFTAGTTGFTPSIATTGAVTLAGILIPANGGTGVNNSSFTMTLGGNLITAGAFTTSGANALTLTTTGTTNVTLPTTGTLLTSASAVSSFNAGTTGFTPSSATTGAVTLAGILIPANGGTGVNNGASTITLGGGLTTAAAFTTSGANALTLTTTGTTNVTLPTTGT